MIIASASSEARTQVTSTPRSTNDTIVLQAEPEIIVLGRRVTDADPADVENRLDGAGIATFGTETISELLNRLKQYNGGQALNIIVDGRRLAGISDLSKLPPAALTKIEILTGNSAGRYGFINNRKVVNLVLKSRFETEMAELSDSAPTRGGTQTLDSTLSYAEVRNERRITASLNHQSSGELLESGRDLIDSTLSATENAHYQSLLPETDTWSLDADFARPYGKTSVSLNMAARISQTKRHAGTVVNNSQSAGDGQADLVPTGLPPEALLAHATNADIQGSANWSGIGNNYSWSLDASASFSQNKIDTVARPLSSTPSTSPVGSVTKPVGLRIDRQINLSKRYGLGASLQGPVAHLPAGPVDTSLRLNLASTGTSRRRSDQASYAQRNWSGILTSTIPLIRDSSGFFGDVSLNTNGSYVGASDVTGSLSYEAILSWTPAQLISLSIGRNYASALPTGEQLHDPATTYDGILVFDPRTNMSASVTQIRGGSPGLRTSQEATTNARINGNLGIGRTRASYSMEYVSSATRNPIFQMDLPSLLIDEAMPTLFQRDGDGNLTSIDTRPFNADSYRRNSLRVNFHLSGDIDHGTATAGRPLSQTAEHWDLELSHDWVLGESLRLLAGGPSIDLFKHPFQSAETPPRHNLSATARLTSARMTAQGSATWHSGSRIEIQGPDATKSFRYGSLLILSAETSFILTKGLTPNAKGTSLRLNLKILNILDQRPTISGASGPLPITLQPDFLDPLGRVICLTVKKNF